MESGEWCKTGAESGEAIQDVEMPFPSSMKEWLGFDCWEIGGGGLLTTGPLLENAQREEGSIPLY